MERRYRNLVQCEDLHSFTVRVGESDLSVLAQKNLSREVHSILQREREHILRYGREEPGFLEALFPLDVKPYAPRICGIMANAANKAHVGPMAAVAGALNDLIDEALHLETSELIVENGGDLLIRSAKERVAAIYAGIHSPFSTRIGLLVPGGRRWGVCTSSGVVGPSMSFGQADAVTVIAEHSAVADAWATALANRVQTEEDIGYVLDSFQSMEGVEGIIVVQGKKLGVRGVVHLVPLQ